MFLVVLKVLRTLLAYLVIGVLLGLFCIPLLPFMEKDNYAFNVWYSLDVAICTIAHGTKLRTISGWSGQHALTKKRYRLQAKVIDFLAFCAGDGKNHCYRAYVWELEMGFVKGTVK